MFYSVKFIFKIQFYLFYGITFSVKVRLVFFTFYVKKVLLPHQLLESILHIYLMKCLRFTCRRYYRLTYNYILHWGPLLFISVVFRNLETFRMELFAKVVTRFLLDYRPWGNYGKVSFLTSNFFDIFIFKFVRFQGTIRVFCKNVTLKCSNLSNLTNIFSSKRFIDSREGEST